MNQSHETEVAQYVGHRRIAVSTPRPTRPAAHSGVAPCVLGVRDCVSAVCAGVGEREALPLVRSFEHQVVTTSRECGSRGWTG
jgi:hypothetical protein